MSVDLRFKRLLDRSHPVDLVLGVTDADDRATLATFDVTIPVTVHAEATSFKRESASFFVTIALVGGGQATYDNAVMAVTQNFTRVSWQEGTRLKIQRAAMWQESTPMPVERAARWGSAAPTEREVGSPWNQAASTRVETATAWEEGTALRGDDAVGAWQEATRMGRSVETQWQEAAKLAARMVSSPWQERSRDSRPDLTGRWQEAVKASATIVFPWGEAALLSVDRRMPWQEARKPLPGRSPHVPPTPEPEDPCYVPPRGNAVELLFKERWDGSTTLLFKCDHDDPQPPAQVVIPVRKVYLVINETSLWRVDGDVLIPTFSMSLSLDVDSWTWGFTASVPGSALPDLEPSAFGEPVELEMRINGARYRVLAESRSRERTFNSSRVTLRGRGKAALLDAPYAAVQSFGNVADITAQQLMADVLTLNGVSIGWDVDWQLVDWTVPAGVWQMQGTWIGALNAIAGAAGGYIQPHAVDQTLRVLHRYPFAPWDWATEVTPDVELPAAVVQREGVEWVNKAMYNRVFVAGQAGGRMGQVTRGGTAGDLLAPMVTDSLLTDTPVLRQRGRAILSDVGPQATVSLRAPVLEEAGVITPGKFVRYVDGATTRLGIVRSTAVDVGMPEVWQTLTVETHE